MAEATSTMDLTGVAAFIERWRRLPGPRLSRIRRSRSVFG
jgi:hypothetical protein